MKNIFTTEVIPICQISLILIKCALLAGHSIPSLGNFCCAWRWYSGLTNSLKSLDCTGYVSLETMVTKQCVRPLLMILLYNYRKRSFKGTIERCDFFVAIKVTHNALSLLKYHENSAPWLNMKNRVQKCPPLYSLMQHILWLHSVYAQEPSCKLIAAKRGGDNTYSCVYAEVEQQFAIPHLLDGDTQGQKGEICWNIFIGQERSEWSGGGFCPE